MFGGLSKKLGFSEKKKEASGTSSPSRKDSGGPSSAPSSPPQVSKGSSRDAKSLHKKPPEPYGVFPADIWKRLLERFPFALLKRFTCLSKALNAIATVVLSTRRFKRLVLATSRTPIATIKEYAPQQGSPAICVASKGRILVVQNSSQAGQNSCTFRFLGYKGSLFKQLEVSNLHAFGAACSSEGHMFISCRDPGAVPRGFIAKLDETGATLQQFGRKYLVMPQEIVIDSSDTLFVADLCSLKIFVFSKAGVFLREILTDTGSIPSNRERLTALAIDMHSGHLFELRPFQPIFTKSRIKLFNAATGECVKTFECDELAAKAASPANDSESKADENYEKAAKAANPKAIAVDSAGRIFLADAWSRTILVFDANGNRISQFRAPSVVGDTLLRLLVLEDGSLFVQGPEAAVIC